MPIVPQDPDIQPEQSPTEAPTAGATLSGDAGPRPAEPVATPTEGMPRIAPSGDQPRRRHRRRRHRQSNPAAASTALTQTPVNPPNPPAKRSPAEASIQTTPEQTFPTQLPTENSPRKRRRRRRRRPRPEAAELAAATGDPASGALGDVVQASAATQVNEPRRDRENRKNRGEQSSDLHVGDGRNANARGPRDKSRARERKEGRDRRAFAKKPDPKLYQLESIVDRGFEDVPDSLNEGTTRRVDWTILKRTTAEQRSARALSAIYVLRRDGIESEFTHLGEARSAVHKTINHPEKLTPSKADHAVARGTKK
jgi:hypothetical protein